MEILDETTHRVLTYIEAVTRQGASLTTGAVNAFAEDWNRKTTYKMTIAEQITIAAQMASGSFKQLSSEEAMSAFLTRLGWVTKSKDVVALTEVGRAVLREASSPQSAPTAESTLEIVIDPDNPFAYAQLMTKITSLEDCMIVDPYLDLDQLAVVAKFNTVSRILTGSKDLEAKKAAFGLILEAAQHLEIRTAAKGILHDRFAIPKDGSVYVLGSSLNSIATRFGVVTTLEKASSALIRDQYQKLWDEATAMDRVPVGAKKGS
ncbi:hypothetical protein AB4Y81_10715 [Paenarthrobacter sp. TAF1]|uniref:hypothetical protein n=1 Tax=Paenarthrobacter sp. TAF1 TaxID=3233067 RepID=UPI003F983788